MAFGCFTRRLRVPLVAISGGLYNFLISEGRVKAGDNLVVFALDPPAKRIRVAQTLHESFPLVEFAPGELGSIFLRLLGEKRPQDRPIAIATVAVEKGRPAAFALREFGFDAGTLGFMQRLSTISAEMVDASPARSVVWKPLPRLKPAGEPPESGRPAGAAPKG
jgi:hypothetical protein